MNKGERAQASGEQLERASRQATDLMRAYHDDPEAWVRLLVTVGTGDAIIYHFDVYWPTWGEQSRVLVRCVGADRWQATFVDEPPGNLSNAVTSSASTS
ncbi:MAG TPA: hypothetical protein VGR57_13340 [Ktedonobacterales bacterium]|nr:hypothetical protein [Ktedonobacterales bacterium]